MTTPAEALEHLAARADRTGLFTDFDGTLSPIVTDPEEAAPLREALVAMETLARRLATVAVVSGRPAAFLARHFAAAGNEAVHLYGLHGLEHWGREGTEPAPEVRPYAEQVAAAVAEARRAGLEDVVVEDKAYAFTLHWRKAPHRERADKKGTALAEELAARYGLLAKPGKASVELVPPVGIDKGSVVAKEGAGLAAAAFLGDDSGDLAAFSALDELGGRGALVYRIAVDSSEAPRELIERADLVLAGPREAAGFLAELAGLLGA